MDITLFSGLNYIIILIFGYGLDIYGFLKSWSISTLLKREIREWSVSEKLDRLNILIFLIWLFGAFEFLVNLHTPYWNGDWKICRYVVRMFAKTYKFGLKIVTRRFKSSYLILHSFWTLFRSKIRSSSWLFSLKFIFYILCLKK